jgi:hypothetical protein
VFHQQIPLLETVTTGWFALECLHHLHLSCVLHRCQIQVSSHLFFVSCVETVVVEALSSAEIAGAAT